MKKSKLLLTAIASVAVLASVFAFQTKSAKVGPGIVYGGASEGGAITTTFTAYTLVNNGQTGIPGFYTTLSTATVTAATRYPQPE